MKIARSVRRFALLAIIVTGLEGVAQDVPTDNQPLIKLGVFAFPDRNFDGFLFNLEMERSIRKAQALTHGPRADYNLSKRGVDNFSVGYQLKVYPFYFLKKNPYNGLYVGGELCYKLKLQNYISGPGLAAQLGYQRTINDRFVVGSEIRMSWVKNVNSEYPGYRSRDHGYAFVGMYLKLGIKLNAHK